MKETNGRIIVDTRQGMSVNNLNNTVTQQPINAGFWEVGEYKANVQRIRDGSNQLDELTKLIKERVEIENKYGKSLQLWNQKWHSYSDRQMPLGYMKSSLDSVLTESKELARVHLAVKDRFNDEVIKTIALFKKENYTRSTIRGLKEAREIESEFEKAQHDWKKIYESVEAAKKHYHNCCRIEKSAQIQMVNSHAEMPAHDGGGVDKIRDRHEKSLVEAKKARLYYEQLLKEISLYNNVYKERMASVFEKCQQMELKRMKFFVEMLSGMQKVLVDLVSPPKLIQIHNNLESIFGSLSDSQLCQDLKQWSLQHGADVPMKCPIFEEYTPGLHNITTKPNNVDSNNGGVILTKKVVKAEHDSYDQRKAIVRQQWSAEFSSKRVGNNHNNDSNNNGQVASAYRFSFSTQDVHLASTTGSSGGAALPKGATLPGSHRRLSSFDSVQDNTTTNSDPNSVNEESNSNSFVSAKSTMPSRKANNQNGVADPFRDPFPMPTPEKVTSNGNRSAKKKEQRQQQLKLSTWSDRHNRNHDLPGNSGEFAAKESISYESVMRNPPPAYDATDKNHNNKASEKSVIENGKENVLPMTNNGSTGFDENPTTMSATAETQGSTNLYGSDFAGEQVRALYDYQATEDDEISLVKGELLEVLRPVDSYGWCYGRKSDKDGYFPAGYVTKV